MASGKLVCVAVDLTEGGMQKSSLKLLQEPLQTVTVFHYPEWRFFRAPPPSVGVLDLDSRSSGCARLGGGVGPPLGVVVEEVAVLALFSCPPSVGGIGSRQQKQRLRAPRRRFFEQAQNCARGPTSSG